MRLSGSAPYEENGAVEPTGPSCQIGIGGLSVLAQLSLGGLSPLEKAQAQAQLQIQSRLAEQLERQYGWLNQLIGMAGNKPHAQATARAYCAPPSAEDNKKAAEFLKSCLTREEFICLTRLGVISFKRAPFEFAINRDGAVFARRKRLFRHGDWKKICVQMLSAFASLSASRYPKDDIVLSIILTLKFGDLGFLGSQLGRV